MHFTVFLVLESLTAEMKLTLECSFLACFILSVKAFEVHFRLVLGLERFLAQLAAEQLNLFDVNI